MRHLAPVSALSVLVAIPICLADEQAAPHRLEWISEYLQEFSMVTDGGAQGPRDIMSTQIAQHPDEGFITLTYRRATYAGPLAESLETTQLIHYTVRLAGLAPGSVRTQRVESFNSGNAYWIVSAIAAGETEFVPYTNVFERRMEDRNVDVTSSRGRVREIVIGYFATEIAAQRLAESFRDMVASVQETESDVQPDGTH